MIHIFFVVAKTILLCYIVVNENIYSANVYFLAYNRVLSKVKF